MPKKKRAWARVAYSLGVANQGVDQIEADFDGSSSARSRERETLPEPSGRGRGSATPRRRATEGRATPIDPAWARSAKAPPRPSRVHFEGDLDVRGRRPIAPAATISAATVAGSINEGLRRRRRSSSCARAVAAPRREVGRAARRARCLIDDRRTWLLKSQ